MPEEGKPALQLCRPCCPYNSLTDVGNCTSRCGTPCRLQGMRLARELCLKMRGMALYHASPDRNKEQKCVKLIPKPPTTVLLLANRVRANHHTWPPNRQQHRPALSFPVQHTLGQQLLVAQQAKSVGSKR